MLLFLPGSSGVAPQPQLWLVSSSSNKVGQFSFVHYSQSSRISSAICHATALGSSPHPAFRGWVSIPTHPADSDKLHSLSVSFSFVGGGMQSAHKLHWIIFPRGHVMCSAHLLGFQIQTGRFGPRLAGRNGRQLFTRQRSLGLGPGWWGICRLSTG
jgi:hypothetical protein